MESANTLISAQTNHIALRTAVQQLYNPVAGRARSRRRSVDDTHYSRCVLYPPLFMPPGLLRIRSARRVRVDNAVAVVDYLEQ